MKRFILLISICFLLTGCLGYNELDNLMIINDIYIKKDSMILDEVIVKKGDIITKSYKKYTVSGNINNCFNKLKKFPRKVYLSHLNNIILDTSINQDDLYNLINHLNKQKELREDFYIVYSKSKNMNTASVQTYLNHYDKAVTYYDLKKALLNKSKIFIPVITGKSNIKTIKYIKIDWRKYEKS